MNRKRVTITLAEAKSIAKVESDLPQPGRKPSLAPFPKLSTKSQLEMITLFKEGKLTESTALEWAEERFSKENVPVLTNEQQLEILNQVKLGRMTIDEALGMAMAQVCLFLSFP